MNDYLVEGTHQQTGAILPDEFKQEITATSSREAYLTVTGDKHYERTLVIVIKIKCTIHGTYHTVVDPNLYL